MAVTWTPTITIENLEDRLVSITAVRSDDTTVRTFSVTGESVDTDDRPLPEIRDSVVDKLFEKYEEAIEAKTKADGIKATYEAAIKTALEARETG